jgi:hypothetical protein
MERYLARCFGPVVRLDGVVAWETLDRARYLIDHGGPGVAIEYLAIVTRQQGKVQPDLVGDLRELAPDLTGLPPDLDDHADV